MLVLRALKASCGYLAQFFYACRILRAPFLVSVFAFMALSLPLQTREVYRVLADDFPNQHWQVLLGFISLLVASGFIWHCGRQTTLIERRGQLQLKDFEGALLRWLPRLFAALVPLGAAFGLYKAIREAETTAALVRSVAAERDWPELDGVYELISVSPSRLWFATLVATGLVLVVLLATILRTLGRTSKYEVPGKWLVGVETSIASVAIAATCIAMFALAPPSLAQAIGVVAIFGLFLAVLVVMLSNLFILGDGLRIPLLSILVGGAIALGALDLNDNHQVPLVEHAHSKDPRDAGRAFERWYNTRNDRDHYADKDEPYPVFIVAAAGGGAYAAHYTATFLARMQDSCPNFAQHVFAISGVSGGSVGAALFAGLAKHKARNSKHVDCRFAPADRYFEKRTQTFFEQDFLSPVVAAGLFPDFVQRFLPFPVGRFDRSRALDASIEAAWRNMAADAVAQDPSDRYSTNPFEQPFLDLWSRQRDDEAVPSLILNTTEVANGYRIVMSPITTGTTASTQWSKIARLHPLLPPSDTPGMQSDIKLSTAAGMSARFPWVLPAASVETGPERKRMRLVDGGYVESSGIDVARQLLKALKVAVDRSKGTPDEIKAKLYLVVLMGYGGATAEDRNIGETPLPLSTLISTWQTRAEISFLGAFLDACPEISTCLFDAAAETSFQRALVELPVIPVFLNLRDFRIPLTWQLTRASREIISLHAGTAQRCERNDTLMITWPEERSAHNRIVKALGENSCSLCTLQYRLAHRSESPEWAEERICVKPTPPPATTSAIGH